MKAMAKQSGLTLVELLIASTLGLILLLGVVQLFVSSSDSFRMAESIGRMQESGRLAQDVLGRAIRNADYWGCIQGAEVSSVLDDGDSDYDPDKHAFVSPVSVEFDVADGSGDLVTGSDMITLRGVSSLGISLADGGQVPESSANVDVTSTDGLRVGDILLMSDCDQGVVFQVTHMPGSKKIQHNTGNGEPGNKKSGGSWQCPGGGGGSNCFPKSFESGDFFKVHVSKYFIEEDAGTGRRALMMDSLDSGKLEIVSDVQDIQMQVGVGVSGNNVINSWLDVTAGNLTTINSSYVKAVRISLLVRSPEDRVARQRQRVCFPAWTDCSSSANLWEPADANDRHYYRVYTSTYSIRNRLLNTGT
ncbi:PilW family protein [Marinobacter vinifirmus]|uniref:Pilus assembly protein PilW n=1 Tax=Marinobacter vinifirmus TaxID=355591 RepID=A0A558BHC1_9GAMM|nr:PilW family protein [Marinobacter vinifirmus]TVT35892.1 MAG: hypothetical protein FHK81_01365 [Marinobacter vinifirmus]